MGQIKSVYNYKETKETNRVVAVNIVNRGDWLGSPANIKGTNKDAKIYVERSTTLHKLLFFPHAYA